MLTYFALRRHESTTAGNESEGSGWELADVSHVRGGSDSVIVSVEQWYEALLVV